MVTGAGGQLGREFQRLSAGQSDFTFLFFSKEDLPVDREEIVARKFEEVNPDFCINCAAYTAVDRAESEKELAFSVNSSAVEILAKLSRLNNCRLIHVSTDYVFDGMASAPYSEDSPTNPQSVYGASKREGEIRALAANPSTIIVRSSWVYSEFGKNFVKTMLRLMSERGEIGLVSDQVGSPTYAADLAAAIMEIVRQLGEGSADAKAGIYHFSNDGVTSWYDFAVAIKELTGSSCHLKAITTSQYHTPAQRPAYSVLDKTKIQQAFNISLKDWRHSLRICLQRLGALEGR